MKAIGSDAMFRDIERRQHKIIDGADDFVRDASVDGMHKMIGAMNASPSPSSPGSAPGVRTGNLIKTTRSIHEKGSLMATTAFGSNGRRGKAPHWHFAEFGTSNQSARPVLRPQCEAAAREALFYVSSYFKGV